jgi:hypothetical protein
MKKSVITVMGLSAIFCACLTLQSCADTSSETTYTTTTTDPGEPVERTTTTTTTRSDDDHDSILGSTLHAVGTIIAAPFRLVGDAISIVL